MIRGGGSAGEHYDDHDSDDHDDHKKDILNMIIQSRGKIYCS